MQTLNIYNGNKTTATTITSTMITIIKKTFEKWNAMHFRPENEEGKIYWFYCNKNELIENKICMQCGN